MQRELSERLDTFARAADDLLSAWMRFDEQGTAYELQEGYPKSFPSFDELVAEIREWAEANTLSPRDRSDTAARLTEAVSKALAENEIEGVDEEAIYWAIRRRLDADLDGQLKEIENLFVESDFVAFRNTRKLVPDLRKHVDGLDFLRPGEEAGFLYDDHFYIHAYPNGQFELVLHNSDFLSYDLAELEKRLHEFAKEEGAWPRKSRQEKIAEVMAQKHVTADDLNRVGYGGAKVVDEVEKGEQETNEEWDDFEDSPLIDALRVALVRTLQEQDALYHLDDDALDVVWDRPMCTFEKEALNEIRDALYGDPKKGGERLHGLCIDAQNAAF